MHLDDGPKLSLCAWEEATADLVGKNLEVAIPGGRTEILPDRRNTAEMPSNCLPVLRFYIDID